MNIAELRGTKAQVMLLILYDVLTGRRNHWTVADIRRGTGITDRDTVYSTLEFLSAAGHITLISGGTAGSRLVYGLSSQFLTLQKNLWGIPTGLSVEVVNKNQLKEIDLTTSDEPVGNPYRFVKHSDPLVKELADYILSAFPGTRAIETKLSQAIESRPAADLKAEADAWIRHVRASKGIRWPAAFIAGQLAGACPVPAELFSAASAAAGYDGYIQEEE